MPASMNIYCWTAIKITLRWNSYNCTATPIICFFIPPQHIQTTVNVPTTPIHLKEHSVLPLVNKSSERCVISITSQILCHKKPFTSQKWPLHTPAPRPPHQIRKTIVTLPEPYGIIHLFLIVETATSMAIKKSMRRIRAIGNASRHPYI